MPRVTTIEAGVRPRRKRLGLWERLKDIDMFFQRRDPVHQAMHRVVTKLKKARIPYAIVGGMAVVAHRHERTTKDVDILLTPEGLETFERLFVPKDYRRLPRRPRRFKDRVSGVTLDILVTGHFPGTGQPGPIAFPDPAQVGKTIEGIRVVDLPTLVQLKLAARRYYDFGDVVHLIRLHKLDESFLSKLQPSVHQDFIECLEEKRREDQYEALSDEAVRKMHSSRKYDDETR